MATGYTYGVQDGQITELRPFAMKCARAFGALITMRDEPNDAPVPETLKPDTGYHDRALADARAEAAKLGTMTAEERAKAAEAAYAKAFDQWKERAEKRDVERARYESMLAQVGAWHAPEAIAGLKAFMAEQLNTSMHDDCDGDYDKEPERISADGWHRHRVAETARSIEYHEKARAEEIARTDERNAWLAALRNSLGMK